MVYVRVNGSEYLSGLTDKNRGESFRKRRGTMQAYKIPSVIAFVLESKGLIEMVFRLYYPLL